MFKPANVVMLPTKNKAHFGDIILTPTFPQQLLIFEHQNCTEVAQHLYITSDEEIKEGDWIFDNYAKINLIQRVRICDLESSHNRNGNWKKIIATTDELLRIDSTIRSIEDDDYGKIKFIIPLVSKQFIEKYIEEYNKGNVITKVEVEYAVWNDIGQVFVEILDITKKQYFKLKVNPDNTINIKQIKNSWSREEIPFDKFEFILNYLKNNDLLKNIEFIEECNYVSNWINKK